MKTPVVKSHGEKIVVDQIKTSLQDLYVFRDH